MGHRLDGYDIHEETAIYNQCFLSLPQDMEALKRSLALIESKMAQAKNWLKDPHGQPGNQIYFNTSS